MFRKILLLTILCMLASQTAYARIYIPVDQPSDQKFPIAVTDLRGGGTGREISSIIRNDLTLSGYFNVLPTELFRDVAKEEGSSDESIRFAYWSAIGAHAMVKGEVESKSGKTTITLRLFDTQSREMLVGKQYKVDKDNMRRAAHRFSDEIMEALTGIRGVFNTKITFTAVTGKKTKDIFVMDMDGYKPYAVTHNKSITLSSAWSPDGGSLVYTSYHHGNPDLYITRLGQKDQKRITNGQGSNITPAWSPDGGTIAFASSISGSSNIYTMPPSGKKMNRVTRNYNIDISPAWAPGGDQIVFSSERAGGLHLFKMSSSGDNISRLTFVGYQNDMPDWSPIGDKIVFAGRDMGTFDIFIMNPDGSNIQRLTIGTGSNEHPTFSPDGRLITFSSTRDGGAAIYIMRSDGSNQTRISKGNGLLPAWGPKAD